MKYVWALKLKDEQLFMLNKEKDRTTTEVELGFVRYLLRDGQLHDLGGNPIQIRAKSRQVLTLLISNVGTVVSKDDLAESIWPESVATDESISQCISDIRKALGDHSHQILETFPKLGYRINLSYPTTVDASAFPRRWPVIITLLVAAIAIGLALFYMMNSMTLTQNPSTEDKAVAVLLFQNRSDQMEHDYFAIGFAEDLVIRLSELSGLRVISSAASFSLSDRSLGPEAIAKNLGTRYLVDGSVRRVGQQLRISVQLIDGQNGTNVWAKNYDGRLLKVLQYHDDVLHNLTEAISLRLTGRDIERLNAKGTQNPKAYDELLRGRLAVSFFTHEQSLIAERHFRQAIEEDQNYALAYAELAAVFAIRFENNWSIMSRADEEKALFFGHKALELDPGLAFAEYALGRLYSVISNQDLTAAEVHLERAMALQPGNDDPRVYFAVVQNLRGKPESAIAILKEVLASHPNPPFWYYYGYGDALFQAKRYEDAVDPLNQCLEQLPNSPYCLRFQIANYAQLGRLDDADWAIVEYTELGYRPTIYSLMQNLVFASEKYRIHLEASFLKAGLSEK